MPTLHLRARSDFFRVAQIALFSLTVAACSSENFVESTSTTGQGGGGSPQTGFDNSAGSGNTTIGDDAFVEPTEKRDIGLVINEIMANIALSDDDANKADFSWRRPWLELYNSSNATINLTGFRLHSKGSETASWAIPGIDIASGAYIRFWGTGFDRRTNINDLHTGFPIMGDNTLTLVDAENRILDRVEDVYFPRDQAWGRFPDGADTIAFSDEPTPGAPNLSGNSPFSINCEDMSLTTGTTFNLVTSPATPVTWRTSNPVVTVSSNGEMRTTASGVAGDHEPVVVTATDALGHTRECYVAVVDWVANLSKLDIIGSPRSNFMLSYLDDTIYYTLPGELWTAEDGFKNDQRVGTFPRSAGPPTMLKTQYGYFSATDDVISSSTDFQNWNTELTMAHGTLQHGFAHHFNQSNQTEYLYAGEYSVELLQGHSVHRGINTGPNTQWDTRLSWGPEQDFYDDNTKFFGTIRHVHTVATDPYTGHVWVGTGDVDQHSRLYFSDDNGETFRIVAMGSQKFRTLSIWFTERYVYWNMDSERALQHVNRLPRTVYNENNDWPALTPILSSGSTKVGVRYLVMASAGGNFPSTVGRYFVETGSHALSPTEQVMAIDDADYDYAESVANLTHASQWYHLWVKDQNDEDVLLMATSAEGSEPYLRDNNSRVFGFKERADGSVDVQELLAMTSRTPRQPNRFNQLIPNMQDNQGYIYFRGRETARRNYKTRLIWNNQ